MGFRRVLFAETVFLFSRWPGRGCDLIVLGPEKTHESAAAPPCHNEKSRAQQGCEEAGRSRTVKKWGAAGL